MQNFSNLATELLDSAAGFQQLCCQVGKILHVGPEDDWLSIDSWLQKVVSATIDEASSDKAC